MRHVGGTSIPGALTKGDLDIQVRVESGEFCVAISRLDKLYTRAKRNAWRAEFAVFEAPAADLPEATLVSVVSIGSTYDWNGAGVWELLATDPALLARYNALKTRHSGGRWDEYEEEKTAFFRDLQLERRPPNS